MSVHRKAKSPFWHYDFVIKGRRFHGSTGQETRRAAEAFVRRLRIEAAEGRLDDACQLTLDHAAGKYWTEHGRRRRDADRVEQRLEQLLTLIPRTTKLADITTPVVSEAVQRRMSQTYRKSTKDDAKTYPVANATVNRDVLDTLRPILRRAKTHWGARGLPEIAWADLRLETPRETVRVYSASEQAAWTAQNGPTAAFALRLMLTYGLRFGELFFPLDAFEAEGPRLTWMKGRKRDVPHTVPLLAADAREISARVGRARAAGLATIWFVEEQGDDGRVALVALTYYGLQQRLRTSSKRAGIRQGRVIHGARHHAGTVVQRIHKNAKVTQRLLGHLDPKSTNRYVHVMDDDVLEALKAVDKSRNSPEPKKRDRKKRKS